VVAQGVRTRADPEAVRAELRSPASAFGALALVAATEVIASRLALAGLVAVATAVGACGVVRAAVLLPAAGAAAVGISSVAGTLAGVQAAGDVTFWVALATLGGGGRRPHALVAGAAQRDIRPRAA
jgi:hypothetical protein